jgi:hypothetical protein
MYTGFLQFTGGLTVVKAQSIYSALDTIVANTGTSVTFALGASVRTGAQATQSD